MEYEAVMKDDNFISIHFESILDLMDYDPGNVNRIKFNHHLKQRYPSSKIDETNQSGSDVIEHALIGDDTMHEKMTALSERLVVNDITRDLEQRVKIKKRKKINTVFGDELDIHKVYQGNFEKAWSTTIREEVDQEHHLVTLYIDIGDNWGADCDQSLWRGAVVLKLMKELELAGKSIKIIVGEAGTETYPYDKRITTTSIVVKNYNENLAPTRLAAMIHLGFFRIFCFAAFYADKKLVPYVSLGRTYALKEGIVPVQLKGEVEAGHTKIVYIKASKSLNTAQRALEDAYKQMKSFAK